MYLSKSLQNRIPLFCNIVHPQWSGDLKLSKMNIEIKKQEKINQFEPFKIEINVDTKREAEMLLCLTNNSSALFEFINSSQMMGVDKDFTIDEVGDFDCIWSRIDGELKKQGIR